MPQSMAMVAGKHIHCGYVAACCWHAPPKAQRRTNGFGGFRHGTYKIETDDPRARKWRSSVVPTSQQASRHIRSVWQNLLRI